MAMSATFTANFSSFYDAVDKAELKLRDFGDGADKVAGRLTTLGNSFSGVKIVQDAALMVKAVEDLGGTTLLTSKEMERLGRTSQEAVEKMKKLGMEVPQNLQKIADETKGANKASIDWMGTLTKVAGAVGIAFSIDAIVGFIGSVFDAASAVKDLANQWGFSTKAAQQWAGAAKDSGISAETAGKSILYLTDKLHSSDKEYDALLKNIGLSGEALRKMDMEQAYREVLTAITRVEDKTLQLNLATGLLGPVAKQMIGGIRDGYVEATDKQKIFADKTVEDLKRASDSWKKLKDDVIIYTGEMIGSAAARSKVLFESWASFSKIAGLTLKQMFAGGNLAQEWIDTNAALDNLAKGLGTTTAQIKPFVQGGKAADISMEGLGKSIQWTGLTIAPTTVKIKANTAAMETSEQVTARLKKEEEARTAALKKQAAAEEEAARKAKAHDDALDKLVDTFAGGVEKANLYLAALKQSIPIEQMTLKAKADIHAVMEDGIASYEAMGRVAPAAMWDAFIATEKAAEECRRLGKNLYETSTLWSTFAGIVNTNPIDLGKGFQMADAPGASALERFGTSISRISLAIGDIGKMSGGTFGEIAGAVSGVAGGLEAGALAAEDFDKALKNFKGPNADIAKGMATTAAAAVVAAGAFLQMTEGATVLQSTLTGAAMGASLAPGPYMAYGAAIGAVVGYVRGLHTANEDTISNLNKMKFHIAEAAGGWDKLAAAAKNAGAMQEYYALHNAESSQEIQWAAEQLGKQLEFQATALEKVNEVAQRYGITLEELGPAMQRSELDKQAQQLYHDWEVLNGAGLETVVITEKMGAEMSAYINQAEKMGTDVPIAMKPMIEAMIKAGTLTDENGVAFEDLEASGISFAMTMSDGFKAMIDEVKKLTDAIARGLGLAIENIPQPVIRGRVEWEGGRATPENIPRPEGGRPGGGLAPEYARGTDGFVNFGRGTPVILHGWEAVVPRGDGASLATVASSAGAGGAALGGGTSVVINAQGAFFQSPADLQRLADRVGDALTAKWSVMGKLRAAV